MLTCGSWQTPVCQNQPKQVTYCHPFALQLHWIPQLTKIEGLGCNINSLYLVLLLSLFLYTPLDLLYYPCALPFCYYLPLFTFTFILFLDFGSVWSLEGPLTHLAPSSLSFPVLDTPWMYVPIHHISNI